MVDAFDVQHVQRLPDVFRRTLLTGMSDEMQAHARRALIYLFKQFGRIADFRGVQTDRQQFVGAGCRGVEQGLCRFDRQVAYNAENQRGVDAICVAASRDAVLQTVKHKVVVESVVHMHLQIEEDLRAAHPVLVRVREVGEHQIGEVLAGAQHAHELVVQVEEGLQVGEIVAGAQIVKSVERQGDAVAFRHSQGEFRFQRAFDMQVKFGFGQALKSLRYTGTDGHGVPPCTRTAARQLQPDAADYMAFF